MSNASFDSLIWIKSELERTLETARRRLDAYAEASDNPALLEAFIAGVHQVAGAFTMIEMRGGQMLAEHMEALARAIREGPGEGSRPGEPEAFELLKLLMRAALELSNYLERMGAGMPDTPSALFPIVNEIRARLGQAPLAPAAPTPNPRPPDGEDLASLAARLRPDYQAALLAFYRGEDESAAIARMARVTARLEAAASARPVFELLWIGGGLLEALGEGGITPTLAIKKTLGQFERELARLAAGSETAVAMAPPKALRARMLSEIAQANSGGERIAAIRAAFGTQSEAAPARGVTSGSALFASVGGAILENLSQVRDRIDIFVRTGGEDIADLEPLDGRLKQVGDALAMLGLEKAQEHVAQAREALRGFVADGAADEALLLGLATGLIGVEGEVEARLGGSGEAERSARIAVLREALADLSYLKEAFGEYLSSRSSGRLAQLPSIAEALARTLEFLALADVAGLIRRIGAYLAHLAEEGASPERAPETMPKPTELDRFADAVVSVEYYLESLRRGCSPAFAMLEDADRALRELEADGARPAGSPAESGDEAPVAAPEPGGAQIEALPPVRAPGGDPEIVALFLEEADEVREAMNAAWSRWQSDPEDREALVVIRRAFHTLKGSGRMVGALRLGEFAWAWENLLNRVIDYTLSPSEPIVAGVGEAIVAVGELLDQFNGGPEPASVARELIARAWRLAQGAGGLAPVPVGIPAQATPVEAEADEAPAVEREPTPRINPVLYGIYRRETEGHLAALTNWLSALAEGGDATVTFDLYRAVHTLAGSAHMAGVTEMASLFAALDTVLHRIGERNKDATGRLAPSVEAVLETGRALLDAYADEKLPIPEWQSLADRLETLGREMEAAQTEVVEETEKALGDAVEEAEVEIGNAIVGRGEPEVVDVGGNGGYDGELAEVFVAEAGELLDGSDAAVHAWSGDRALTEPLTELLRRLHTLKGGARMAGVVPLGDLTHALESVLMRVADGRIAVSSELVHLVERTLDRLHRMLMHVAGDGKVPLDAALAAELQEFAGGGAEALREEAAEVSREVEIVKEAEEVAGAEAISKVADRLCAEEAVVEPVKAMPEAPKAERYASSQLRHEMARVRADLLEASINNAGEASIYRGRIEQQTVNMGVHVAELDRTVERLRNQLRELEIETEAQILSSHERERPEDPGGRFDPLEFDRYTRIHELSRSLAEAVSDLVSLRGLFASELRQVEVQLERQGRVNAELQDALMRTRMAPFALSAPRLRRVVRQVSEETGKRVAFELRGADGEMDRQLIAHILPALEHLLRNAVVHGIEAPELRGDRGKPAEGQVSLTLRRDGGDMLIDIADDGGGLDLGAIRAKAEEEGFLAPEAKLTDAEITELVFRSGFSTAGALTQSAGRGVGMDVVAAEARQVGGSAEIYSTSEKGTCCRMRLPATLAITQALLVRVGRTRYAVALASIGAVARLARDEVERLFALDEPTFEYAGEKYRLVSLARLLGEAPPPAEAFAPRRPLLLVNAGARRVALVVEDMEGSREIVVKPVGPQIARVPGLAGATIFGDGSIGLMLDLSGLVRALPRLRAQLAAPLAPSENEREAIHVPLIMIVDDSITVRRVTQRLLERHGARVLTAKDGVDALELLQDHRPDAMLLDIEMPRMDGYELAGHMKNDARLAAVPIIVITSRTGAKHRERAAQVGIAHYLGKPYQDATLFAALREVAPNFAARESRSAEPLHKSSGQMT
jgi:chemosensory pili system protein ChpA (sensor histidine kinase/response regulator)